MRDDRMADRWRADFLSEFLARGGYDTKEVSREGCNCTHAMPVLVIGIALEGVALGLLLFVGRNK